MTSKNEKENMNAKTAAKEFEVLIINGSRDEVKFENCLFEILWNRPVWMLKCGSFDREKFKLDLKKREKMNSKIT